MSVKNKVEGVIPEVPFNGILLSAYKPKRTSNIILTSDAETYEEVQEVVKAGPGATYGGNPGTPVEVGDIVVLNYQNFLKRKLRNNSIKNDIEDVTTETHEVSLPITVFHNKEYMRVTDRDILYYWKGIK